MNISWNDRATVKLNDLGKKMLADYFAQLGLPVPKYCAPADDGTFAESLWFIANVFGPTLYHGGRMPFVDTAIKLLRM